MFKKLLSNLPFNPSLITQVSFYSQRMKRETSVRRMGSIFIALTMVIQFFAVISPPKPTLANSANDIINGGFASKTEAINHCNGNSQDFQVILARFGISCANVAASTTATIRSTDYNRKLLSLGRIAYGRAGERPQVINGRTYYQRYLWSWDTGAYSSYTALVGTTNNGAPFMILYNCGNVTVVETTPTPPPAPAPPPPPPPTPTNNLPTASFAANCTAVSWRASDSQGKPRIRIFIATATGDPEGDWARRGTAVHDVNIISAVTTNNGTWPIPSQYRNSTTRYRVFVVVNDKLPNGQIDNTISTRVTPSSGIVFGPCVTPTPTPPPPAPTPPVTPPPPTDVCLDIPGTQTNQSQCKPCDQASNNDATACLLLSKSALNKEKGLSSADSIAASPGETIIYTLTAINTGKVTVNGFAIEENIGDVLDYADIVDLHGGVIDSTNTVRWPEASIAPGATSKRELTVKIKDTIPTTPTSTSDPGHFDGRLTNVYGNTVTVTLPLPPVKQIEITTTTTLPSTGPGTSLIIGFAVTSVIMYFFARSKLFATELDIVRHDYAQAGSA